MLRRQNSALLQRFHPRDRCVRFFFYSQTRLVLSSSSSYSSFCCGAVPTQLNVLEFSCASQPNAAKRSYSCFLAASRTWQEKKKKNAVSPPPPSPPPPAVTSLAITTTSADEEGARSSSSAGDNLDLLAAAGLVLSSDASAVCAEVWAFDDDNDNNNVSGCENKRLVPLVRKSRKEDDDAAKLISKVKSELIHRRILPALELRRSLSGLPNVFTSVFRAVHGRNDGVPGVEIDIVGGVVAASADGTEHQQQHQQQKQQDASFYVCNTSRIVNPRAKKFLEDEVVAEAMKLEGYSPLLRRERRPCAGGDVVVFSPEASAVFTSSSQNNNNNNDVKKKEKRATGVVVAVIEHGVLYPDFCALLGTANLCGRFARGAFFDVCCMLTAAFDHHGHDHHHLRPRVLSINTRQHGKAAVALRDSSSSSSDTTTATPDSAENINNTMLLLSTAASPLLLPPSSSRPSKLCHLACAAGCEVHVFEPNDEARSACEMIAKLNADDRAARRLRRCSVGRHNNKNDAEADHDDEEEEEEEEVENDDVEDDSDGVPEGSIIFIERENMNTTKKTETETTTTPTGAVGAVPQLSEQGFVFPFSKSRRDDDDVDVDIVSIELDTPSSVRDGGVSRANHRFAVAKALEVLLRRRRSPIPSRDSEEEKDLHQQRQQRPKYLFLLAYHEDGNHIKTKRKNSFSSAKQQQQQLGSAETYLFDLLKRTIMFDQQEEFQHGEVVVEEEKHPSASSSASLPFSDENENSDRSFADAANELLRRSNSVVVGRSDDDDGSGGISGRVKLIKKIGHGTEFPVLVDPASSGDEVVTTASGRLATSKSMSHHACGFLLEVS